MRLLEYSFRSRYTAPAMTQPPIKKHISVRFLQRTVLFLFSFLIALFILFIVGNIQNFLDASQIIILQLQIGVGVLLFLLAGFSILFEIYYGIMLRKKWVLIRFIINGLASAFGLITAIISAVILLLSAGLPLS